MHALLLVGALIIAVPDRPDRTPPEVKRQHPIHGDWEYLQHSPSMLRLLPGESQFMIGGKISRDDGFTGACVIDWTQDPIHIDIIPRRGGAKLVGILRLEGDRLTLEFSHDTSTRPRGFGVHDLRYEFKRVGK